MRPFLLIYSNFNLLLGRETQSTWCVRPQAWGVRPQGPSRKLTDISQVTHINFLLVPGAPGRARQRCEMQGKTTLPGPLRPPPRPPGTMPLLCWAPRGNAFTLPQPRYRLTFQSRRLTAPTSSTPVGKRTIAAGPKPTKNRRKSDLKMRIKMSVSQHFYSSISAMKYITAPSSSLV